MQASAAAITAPEVTEAPDTTSISAPCASRIFAAKSGPRGLPMPSVSLSVETTTSVMLLASKVMVTVTSPMPVAVAE